MRVLTLALLALLLAPASFAECGDIAEDAAATAEEVADEGGVSEGCVLNPAECVELPAGVAVAPGPVSVDAEAIERVIGEIGHPSGTEGNDGGRPMWTSPVEPGDPCDGYG